MIAALLLGTILFVASLSLHLRMIGMARRVAPTDAATSHARTLSGHLVVFVSHLLVAALFAVGFAFAVQLSLGEFAQEPSMSWMDYYYYSIINVTTVGLAQIYPTGHLRVLTGIESLTGFMIISCSAQYIYKSMSKQED